MMPVMTEALRLIASLFERGGWVMWPLAILSLLSVALIVERSLFWLRMHSRSQRQLFNRLAEHLRLGQIHETHTLLRDAQGIYAELVRRLLAGGASDAAAVEAIESLRSRLHRYMTTLGTIVTAAPMLGILGTVTGIIASFRLLGDERIVSDPSIVGAGIAEALITTVAGLIVALVVLFPYNAFRAQIDQAMGRFETLIAAAQHPRPDADRADRSPE